MKKILLTCFAIGLTLSVIAQNDFETQYKSIVMDLSNQFSKSMKCAEGKCFEPKKPSKEEAELDLQIINENAEKLEVLLAQEATINDKWADDALYILSSLYLNEPEKKFVVLERIVSDYPDIKMESWTKNNIPYLMPENFSTIPDIDHVQVNTRMDLYAFYGDIHETKKLKKLHEETLKKLPESAEFFEIFYKRIIEKIK